MRISLINAYSTRNVGDAAIYHALATLSESPVPLQCSLPEPKPLYVPGVEFHTGSKRKSDLYVSVGGDIFNNARPGTITRNFIGNLRTLGSAPASRTILFGQSIPRSCRGASFRLLARRLRKLASVTVRDVESYQRLRLAGVAARLSYDAAFIIKPNDWGRQSALALLGKHSIEPDKAAVVSLRSFDSMYPIDNHQLLEKITRLCSLLTQRGLVPVVLMQSEAYGADNDHAMLQELQRTVPQLQSINPFAPSIGAHPWETAIGLLEVASIAVAVRYHTAIFRTLSGRCPYNLYYSNKGEDLVQRLGMPGKSIEDFDPDRHIGDVMASARRSFDIFSVRNQLSKDFQTACLLSQMRQAA